MQQILNFSHLSLYLRFLINLRLFRFAVHRGSLFYLRLSLSPSVLVRHFVASPSSLPRPPALRHFGPPGALAHALAPKRPGPTTFVFNSFDFVSLNFALDLLSLDLLMLFFSSDKLLTTLSAASNTLVNDVLSLSSDNESAND
jgi:hypothetical protein